MKIRKEELFLLAGTILVTLFLSLVILRTYAPQLLGIPIDLQMVRTAKEVPPFFENVFRPQDYQSKNYLLPDPVLKRAKPLFPAMNGLGPNDILGFRNRTIPSVVDLIVIGDSQTYGNNVYIDENWPHKLGEYFQDKYQNFAKYDMAVGGWGAIEYLEAFNKALYFKPKAVLVAFYSGNDSLESFRLAYSNDRWKNFRTDATLDTSDIPSVAFPAPAEKQWSVTFADGVKTVFTPELRLINNFDHPVSRAGYEIMALVAEKINEISRQQSIDIYFTIIPTKEFVYSNKINSEGLQPSKEYLDLIKFEKENIDALKNRLHKLKYAKYIDVIDALKDASMGNDRMYPEDADGHPIALGYKVIADALAPEIEIKYNIPDELFALLLDKKTYQLAVVRENKIWLFANVSWVEANGWKSGNIPSVNLREVANIKIGGIVSYIDKKRFGPRQQ